MNVSDFMFNICGTPYIKTKNGEYLRKFKQNHKNLQRMLSRWLGGEILEGTGYAILKSMELIQRFFRSGDISHYLGM